MKRPKGMGPGPKLKPVNNVHSMSKSAAVSAVGVAKERLTSMLMLLGAVCERHGPQTFTRDEVEFTNPARLHIRENGELIQCWWGDQTPAGSTLAIVQDDEDGAPDAG